MQRWTRIGNFALTDDPFDKEATRGPAAQAMLDRIGEHSLEAQDLRRFLWELGHFDIERMNPHQVLSTLDQCLNTGVVGVLPWARMQEILFTPRSSEVRATGDSDGGAARTTGRSSAPAPARQPPPQARQERADSGSSNKSPETPVSAPKASGRPPAATSAAAVPISAGLQAIKDAKKGVRPDPSTYLQKEYIDAHLKKFEEGASYLVKKSALDTFGRQKLGMPDNSQFVMPNSQMDAVLRKANGDLAIVETELGIPKGAWQGSQMVRIDIPEPKKLNLRMPSGNEMGANDEWLPGGQLPTGFDEAVTDKIPIGSYLERPLW